MGWVQHPTWATLLEDYGNGMVVNGEFMYVSCPLHGFITKINLSDGSVVKNDWATGLSWPAGLAVYNQYLYVINNAEGTISKLDLTTGLGVRLSWVTGLDTPQGLVIDGQYLYVANNTGNNISRLNLTNSTVTYNWATGLDGPCAMAINGQYMYVTTIGNGKIAQLNLTNGSVVTYDWGKYPFPYPTLLTTYGQYLYVSDFNLYSIARLNLADGSVDQLSYLLGGFVNSIYIYGKYLFVAVADGTFDRIVKLDTGVTTSETYSASQLQEAGYSISQLQQSGYTHTEIIQGGYTESQLLVAGYTVPQLIQAGYAFPPESEAVGKIRSFPPIQSDIVNNNELSGRGCMPLKDNTSDGTSTFSSFRQRSVKTAAAPNKKKWYGNSSNRSASAVSEKRNNEEVGIVSKNPSGSKMSFTSHTSRNDVQDALSRVRGGGYMVHKKNKF